MSDFASQSGLLDFDRSLVGLTQSTKREAGNRSKKRAKTTEKSLVPAWRRWSTFGVLSAAFLFNLFLCFVNTVVFGINANMVILCEMAILAFAFLLAANLRVSLYVTLALFLSYMMFIMALRPGLDLKAVRDILVPIAFYFVGRNLQDIRLMDKFAVFIGLLVVGFGFFEWAALDVFLQYFRPLDYYIARGTVDPSDVSELVRESGLFASGTRYGARNILPTILGDHRVSSIFLEPVSMGNFGAILFLWAIFRKDMHGRWIVFACAAAVIALSDARFGMFATFAVAAALFVAPIAPRISLFALPFIILTGLFVYGQTTIAILWEDDFLGRMLWSSKLVTSLSWQSILGISGEEFFVADSGYAYTLTQIGIFGALLIWALFVYSSGPNKDAWRFRFGFGIYLAINLLVSNSAYSIKTGAILWVMLGVADCVRRKSDSRTESHQAAIA